MINKVFTAVYAFPMRKLTSFSVDEIMLPKYVNKSNNLRGLTFIVEMVPSCLKYMICVLSELI